MTITGDQVRAARKLLGWSQVDLQLREGVSQSSVSAFERGGQVRRRTISLLRQALEAAGVEFTNGGEPGVTLEAVGRIISSADPDAPAPGEGTGDAEAG